MLHFVSKNLARCRFENNFFGSKQLCRPQWWQCCRKF